MNLESANLILRTSSVAVGQDKDANITNITWRNINLRVVCGKALYEKYNKFKICITSVGNTNTSALSNYIDRPLYISMKGLPFINQTYDTKTKTIGDTVILTQLVMTSLIGYSLNFTGEVGWVFEKPPSDLVDINIFTKRLYDNSINSAINYGESVYCFAIYGIE